AAGRISLQASHQSDRGDAFSFAEGRTGAGVGGVKLRLDDGTILQATVANGWFVAWWPGAHEVSSAELTTPTGVKSQKFDLHAPEPPGSVTSKTTGASSSTATGRGGRVESFSVSR